MGISQYNRWRHCSSNLSLACADPEQKEKSITIVIVPLSDEHMPAAVDDNGLVACLIDDMVIDILCGRSGWVRWAGCAYDPAAGAVPD